jgi:predicted  nucleic acid-binding Zn-ribbon protein
MSRSKTLYQIQQFDSQIDSALKRIQEINTILSDNQELNTATKIQADSESLLTSKKKSLSSAEMIVSDHSLKIDQNQKKLYSGAVTNPKELESLQQESESLNKYLAVLEERQLEAMLAMEDAQKDYDAASAKVSTLETKLKNKHEELISEKENLESAIADAKNQKEIFLSSHDIPDLQTYLSIRESSGGIAITLMISDSCSSCGANIPSAIAQEAKSPGKIAYCPTCRRILHPG